MKSEDKRELIFAATEELISEMPYGEISVEAIAARAGIGKGSIYYYFSGKDEILELVVERCYKRAVREYLDSLSERGVISAAGKMKLLFESVIKREFSSKEKNVLHFINLNNDLSLHRILNFVAVKVISPVLAQLLRECIAEGTVTTDTPDESAEMIVAVLTFFLDDSIFPDSRERIPQKMKILAKVLESSLQTEKGTFDFLLSVRQVR